MIDWSINIGSIIQIVIFIGGVATLFFGMKGDIRVLRHDVRNVEQRQEALNEAFTQLGAILTQVAVQDTRINRIETDIVDLRHGRGLIEGAH